MKIESICATAVYQIMQLSYQFCIGFFIFTPTLDQMVLRIYQIGTIFIILMRIIELYYAKTCFYETKFSHIYYLTMYTINIGFIIEKSFFIRFHIFTFITNTILICLMYKQLNFYIKPKGYTQNVKLFIPLYALIRLLVNILQTSEYYQADSLVFLIVLMIILQQFKQSNFSPQSQQKEESKSQDDENPQVQRNDLVKISSTEKVKNKQVSIIQYLPFSSRTSIISSRQNKRNEKQEELMNLNEPTLLSQLKRNQSIVSQFDKPDTLILFYQNMMNIFPQGILILNQQKKILYMNNKCERLLEAQGKENILTVLLNCFKNGQFRENGKKRNLTPNQGTNKGLLNQQQFEEVIRMHQNSRNNEFDIIDYLLQKGPAIPSSYNLGESSPLGQTIPRNSSSNLSNEQLNSSVHFYAPLGQNNKLVKLSIIQTFLNSSNIELISQPSHKIQGGGFSSAISYQDHNQYNQNPILYITLKNVSTKQKLQEVQKEYKFQNLLLKSFSHELRTPLNCSIQMLQLLMDVTQTDQFIQKCLSQALYSNQLLMYQINDILDFAAMECHQFQYKWEIVKIDQIAKEFANIYEEACKSKSINFKVKIDSTLDQFSIRTDRSRIMQVLVNLMNNAIKFTKENGKITLKIKLDQNESSPIIKISLKDNGIGVGGLKLANIQKIMQKQGSMFRQTKKIEGIGLGLTISNQIVQGLCVQNNNLKIKSQNQKGTKIGFKVSSSHESIIDRAILSEKVLQSKRSAFFQQSVSKQGNDEERSSFEQFSNQDEVDSHKQNDLYSFQQKQQSFQKQTPTQFSFENKGSLRFQNTMQTCNTCNHVLIVDDVPFNQIALKALLSQQKIESDSAYDGYQALDKVNQKLSMHCSSYKVIFMDIEMPGMNGFQATQQIKQILKSHGLDTYIVMCSAYDTLENMKEGKKAGMSDFVGKPVKRTELDRVAKQYLNLEIEQ